MEAQKRGGWVEMLLKNANLKVNTHDDDNEEHI
jgi:hypothetical protein